jgi:hypothetical protein
VFAENAGLSDVGDEIREVTASWMGWSRFVSHMLPMPWPTSSIAFAPVAIGGACGATVVVVGEPTGSVRVQYGARRWR